MPPMLKQFGRWLFAVVMYVISGSAILYGCLLALAGSFMGPHVLVAAGLSLLVGFGMLVIAIRADRCAVIEN